MTRQIRNIPAAKRGREALTQCQAIFRTGTRHANVTYEHNYRDVQTRLVELVGVGLNAAGTANTQALVIRDLEYAGTALVEFIPLTRLMSIEAAPQPAKGVKS